MVSMVFIRKFPRYYLRVEYLTYQESCLVHEFFRMNLHKEIIFYDFLALLELLLGVVEVEHVVNTLDELGEWVGVLICHRLDFREEI